MDDRDAHADLQRHRRSQEHAAQRQEKHGGLILGPCNDGNVNGNHPALLASLRCNGDVQLPYRFPITVDTHEHDLCEQHCDEKMPIWQLIKEAQANQAAQAGYATDYQNKRLPLAIHEVKDWTRGQQHLHDDMKDKKTGYVGARTTKRLITDCYGRGVVRGAMESCNLILNASQQDPTWAESIKTAPVTEISLRYPLQLLCHIAEEQPWPEEPRRTKVDKRNPLNHEVMDTPVWTLYGGRGKQPEVHQLSAYEFASHYYMKLAKRPFSFKRQIEDPDNFEAELTERGIEKVSQNIRKLVAGEDYKIKEEGGEGWLPLGLGRPVRTYRRDWVIATRRRPNVPVIFGAQGSKPTEEQAMRILVLYFPWVNDPAEASATVPFITDMWRAGMQDWKEALLTHARSISFLTEEVKRMVMSFVFTYCLPRQMHSIDGLEENSDNEDMTDELADIALEEDDLLEATLTHVRGSGRQDPSAEGNNGSEVEEGEQTKLHDMTLKLFNLSGAIWTHSEMNNDAAAKKRYEELLEQVDAKGPFDHAKAKEAAYLSIKQGEKRSKNGKTCAIGEVSAEVEAGRKQ